jgi:hypothetical protein
MTLLINMTELCLSGGTARVFDGFQYGDTHVSFFLSMHHQEKGRLCIRIPTRKSLLFKRARPHLQLAMPHLRQPAARS